MPIFQDTESAYALVPEGDYVLCVYEFITDMSTSEKTKGSWRHTVVFNIEGTDSKLKETLIDHPSSFWKIDTFLKSSGIRSLAKGQEFYFEQDVAEEKGVPWINPMGLRCHARVVHDSFRSNKTGNEITKNKVAAFYTDRPVLRPDPELRKKPTSRAGDMPGDPMPFPPPPSVAGMKPNDDIPF